MTSNEWKKCKLGELCSNITSGGTPKSTNNAYYNNGNIPWLNTKEVKFNRIYNTEKCISELGLNNSSAKWIKPNNVIVAMYGATAGNVAINKIPLTTNQACCNLEIDKSIAHYEFIYYYLLNNYNILFSMANGGAQQNLNSLQIKNFEISIPTFKTQQKIAKVLNAIDDKIELNNSINNNLEQQIKYLYNDYFCNCNEEIKITELIDVRDGTHDSPKSTEQGKHLITSKHLKKYGVDKSTANIISEFDYAKINERSIVCTNDILISMIGTVGIVSLIIENPVDFAVKNVGIFKTSNFIEYTYYIHCFLNSNNTQNYIKSHLAGTTQKYISLGELRNLIINKPDESQLNKFNLIVHPLYQQIILNVKENVRLTQLRDTLLPKLMSGEIDVSKVEIDDILENQSTDKLLFSEDKS